MGHRTGWETPHEQDVGVEKKHACHDVVCVLFPLKLSVGTLRDPGSVKPKANFHGCLENLLHNGLNLIELAKRNDHQVEPVVSAFYPDQLS